MLSIYPALTHFDPEVFPDPDRYVFDRFVERDGKALRMEKGGVPLKHGYLPFGGGVSVCPGRHFARQEVELMIELLLGRCEIEVVEDRLPGFGASRVGLGVLAPDGPYRVRVRMR
jgi:cytochrome P450